MAHHSRGALHNPPEIRFIHEVASVQERGASVQAGGHQHCRAWGKASTASFAAEDHRRAHSDQGSVSLTIQTVKPFCITPTWSSAFQSNNLLPIVPSSYYNLAIAPLKQRYHPSPPSFHCGTADVSVIRHHPFIFVSHGCPPPPHTIISPTSKSAFDVLLDQCSHCFIQLPVSELGQQRRAPSPWAIRTAATNRGLPISATRDTMQESTAPLRGGREMKRRARQTNAHRLCSVTAGEPGARGV